MARTSFVPVVYIYNFVSGANLHQYPHAYARIEGPVCYFRSYCIPSSTEARPSSTQATRSADPHLILQRSDCVVIFTYDSVLTVLDNLRHFRARPPKCYSSGGIAAGKGEHTQSSVIRAFVCEKKPAFILSLCRPYWPTAAPHHRRILPTKSSCSLWLLACTRHGTSTCTCPSSLPFFGHTSTRWARRTCTWA